jgi:hypothetical protein
MTQPHDFEFQLGKNRTLKGRGWRGLLALGLLLMTFATLVPSGSWLFKSLRDSFVVFAASR